MDQSMREHRLVLAGNVDLKFRYACVPARLLQPSHVIEDGGLGPSVQVNERYRGRVQGRVYSSVSLAGDALERAARDPRVDFLLDLTSTAAFGPPLCVHEEDHYKVVAGHQRAAILRYQFAMSAATRFKQDYRVLAAEHFPDLFDAAMSRHDVVVIRLLSLPASVPEETLRAINRVSDAPLTKPRDTLAVVRGLAADIINHGPLASALLACLPPTTSKTDGDVASDQADLFGSESLEPAEQVRGLERSSPHRFLSMLLRSVGDRIRNRYDPPFESLLFDEMRWSRGDSSKSLSMPLLTQNDRLALVQRDSRNRTELTANAARDLAYLTLSILLGGSDRLERLAEVRALHFAQSNSTKGLPGADVLRASTKLVASVNMRMATRRRRLLDMLGRTLLTALANEEVVKSARQQLLLTNDTAMDLSWCTGALEDEAAMRSLETLRTDEDVWTQLLVGALNAPDQGDNEFNPFGLSDTSSLSVQERSTTALTVSRDDVLDLIRSAMSMFYNTQHRGPERLQRGKGRPKISEADLRFTVFLLLRYFRVSEAHLSNPLLVEGFRQRGAERYQQLLMPIADLLGVTNGCSALHSILQSHPDLTNRRLPRLVGVRRLREWLAAPTRERLKAMLREILAVPQSKKQILRART